MAKKTKNKQAELLEMMGKTLDQAIHTSEPGAEPAPQVPQAAKEPTTGRTERVNISLYPEDKAIIRQLSAFFAAQGLPVNASLVIKSALRAAQQGDALLEAYHKARSLDLRSKKARETA